jgi:hypothetical protein
MEALHLADVIEPYASLRHDMSLYDLQAPSGARNSPMLGKHQYSRSPSATAGDVALREPIWTTFSVSTPNLRG